VRKEGTTLGSDPLKGPSEGVTPDWPAEVDRKRLQRSRLEWGSPGTVGRVNRSGRAEVDCKKQQRLSVGGVPGRRNRPILMGTSVEYGS